MTRIGYVGPSHAERILGNLRLPQSDEIYNRCADCNAIIPDNGGREAVRCKACRRKREREYQRQHVERDACGCGRLKTVTNAVCQGCARYYATHVLGRRK